MRKKRKVDGSVFPKLHGITNKAVCGKIQTRTSFWFFMFDAQGWLTRSALFERVNLFHDISGSPFKSLYTVAFLV